MIALEWVHELETKAFVGFSDPTGKPYIRISNEYISVKAPSAWSFHPFNPWMHQIDATVQRILEAGLISKFREQTLMRMKKEAKVDLFKEYGRIESGHKMTLKHLGGIFIMVLILLILSVFIFIFEVCFRFETIKRYNEEFELI